MRAKMEDYSLSGLLPLYAETYSALFSHFLFYSILFYPISVNVLQM